MAQMPNSQSIWNAILTAVGVALLGCLGWQMAEIAKLKEYVATETATEFSEEEADQLRRDMTNVMTDIDMRLSLMERDIEWVKLLGRYKPVQADWETASKPEAPGAEPNPPSPDAEPSPDPPVPPAGEADMLEMPKFSVQQRPTGPRYDMRRNAQQNR